MQSIDTTQTAAYKYYVTSLTKQSLENHYNTESWDHENKSFLLPPPPAPKNITQISLRSFFTKYNIKKIDVD